VFLSIEPASDRPLYTQIRNQIVDALVRGELVEGDRLPSVRQLAVDLGINLHTVNKAYRVLADDGYLSLNGRSGARIIAPPHYTTGYLEDLQATLARLFIEAQSQGIDAALFQTTVNKALAASELAANQALAVGEPFAGEPAAEKSPTQQRETLPMAPDCCYVNVNPTWKGADHATCHPAHC
jgi:DNA-binding transcriptional regulator YhcF (GntR family)